MKPSADYQNPVFPTFITLAGPALIALSLMGGALAQERTELALPPVVDVQPKPVTPAPEAPPAAAPAIEQGAKTQPSGNDAALDKTVAVPFNADLWQRIRKGFSMPDIQTELVRDREQWYTTRPDYIFRMTERARRYLYHVVQELEARGMPTELALLPFIESAFNPQAVSSAKAAGMWQFIPSTGKHFDLKQNVFRDDRRDVQQSTRAALDYLQKLHRMFGDWHLALAAYNWGEGSVQRAIKKNEAAGLPTDYLSLQMPNETRYYVPKLQAVKNIIASPEAFSAQLPEIPDHPYFQAVKITRDIDVALAARLAEVRIEDFKALNPSANKPLIMAAGTDEILLPWDNAPIFQRNLEAHKGPLASWTVWTAPSTMRSAEAAGRVGMGEAEFREVNRIPAGMLVKAGSTLLAPRSGSKTQDVAEYVADNGQIALTPEIILVKRSVRALKRGDSVAKLAQRYRVPATQVANWNRLSPGAALRGGQAVVLYLPQRALQARAPVRARASTATASTSSRKAGVRQASAPSRVNAAAKSTASNKTRNVAKAPSSKTTKPVLKAAPSSKAPVRVAKQ
jgi:membrane-bound lytic murein transglycosylase D